MSEPLSQADPETTLRKLVERHNRLLGAVKGLERLPDTATLEEVRNALNDVIQAIKG